jgi:hypothetical protein
MSLWLWLLPLGQAIGGASWGECCYSDGMLDLTCFYVNGKARDISHGQWGPMFRATEESMTRSIAHAELSGARGHRPQLADWESFVKRAVVSEQLSSRLLRPKTVPEETIASFLQEVDRGVHNCTMDVFFTMALPEEFVLQDDLEGFCQKFVPCVASILSAAKLRHLNVQLPDEEVQRLRSREQDLAIDQYIGNLKWDAQASITQ